MAARRRSGNNNGNSDSAPAGGEDPRTSPIPLAGGMFLAGSATTIPDGYTLLTRNMVIRPNRICSRPPFVYDGLTAVNGFMIWEDLVNQQTRFLALDTSGNLYIKAASGETWSGAITTGLAAGLRLTDYANYRGKLYFMLDDGAGNPTAAAMYDGTTVTVTPFTSAIFARTVTTFIDRLFLSYPRVTTINRVADGPLDYAYKWVLDLGGGLWVYTNISTREISNGTSKVVRVFPTSTAAVCSVALGVDIYANAIYTAMPSVKPTKHLLRQDLRAAISSPDIPIKIELYLVGQGPTIFPFVVPVGYVLGYGGFMYRCTISGTVTTFISTHVPSTALNSTWVWDGATFLNTGSSVIAAAAFMLTGDVAGNEPPFTEYMAFTIPERSNAVGLGLRLSFSNSTQPLLTTLTPVDVSYRDGLTDGTTGKSNWGLQITDGDFYFPFFNQESSYSVTSNLETIVWSETTDPSNIRAANTYEPKESAGLPTAAIVASGRYIDFKRRAFWIFTGTADSDIPILPESPATIGVGCLGPRAITRLRDELFFIGEDEIFRMRVGGYPQPICGDAMRETIMAKGSNWVESQSVANMPLIAVDEKNHELWVYTQKGTLYCYHMAQSTAASAPAALYSSAESGAGAWSQHDVNSAELTAMAYNPTTKKMEFAFLSHGAARFDDGVTAQDTINVAATLYPVTKEITVKPFELTGPRSELCLHDIGLYQLSTGSQAAELLYIYVSFDRGKTFTKYNEVRFDPAVPRVPIPIFQSGVSVTIKITAVGKAGEAIFSLSHADATLELLAGEWPLTNATQIANTLTP